MGHYNPDYLYCSATTVRHSQKLSKTTQWRRLRLLVRCFCSCWSLLLLKADHVGPRYPRKSAQICISNVNCDTWAGGPLAIEIYTGVSHIRLELQIVLILHHGVSEEACVGFACCLICCKNQWVILSSVIVFTRSMHRNIVG